MKTAKGGRKISLPWFRQSSVQQSHAALSRQHTIDTPGSFRTYLGSKKLQVNWRCLFCYRFSLFSAVRRSTWRMLLSENYGTNSITQIIKIHLFVSLALECRRTQCSTSAHVFSAFSSSPLAPSPFINCSFSTNDVIWLLSHRSSLFFSAGLISWIQTRHVPHESNIRFWSDDTFSFSFVSPPTQKESIVVLRARFSTMVRRKVKTHQTNY